ncbi:IS1380 family transposase [Ammoniphilus sp. 3BR4]|uniref:IS1380 family transposase n=1 Tax=Ammoniphilus sp. 3BR4 TaxID=3158265 RepID=UPI0034657DCC
MKSTITISKMKTEFTLKKATSFAGIKVVLDFFEKIQLAAAFQQLNVGKKDNSIFPMHKILLYLVIGWTVGCVRLFHFRSLQQDALIQHVLGGRCPHHSLLYKELGRLATSTPTIKMDLKRLNYSLIDPYLPASLILDFDSTVETVYGNQEKATVGVNSHKRGRKSYHPILVYEGKTRFLLNAELRSGNTHSSTGVIDFANETLDFLSSNRNVQYVRFDKGFGGEDFYSFWENKKIGYVGKLKWTDRLKNEVAKCRYWKRFVDEDVIIEGITMVYKATSWKKSRYVIVIRKAPRYNEDQFQFYDFFWEYEAIVTNLPWEPIDIWRFYNQRACMENYIKEAKHGFSIDAISTSSFKANEVDLLLKLIAYNLYERFKKNCCDPIHQGYTIARFRREFFHIAGVIVNHSRQVILKLNQAFTNQYHWERMAQRVTLLE